MVIRFYGARVDTGGNILDPDGFVLSSMPTFYQYYPSIVFGNTNFLVVWWLADSGIYGCRVTPEGQILDPDAFPISHNSSGDLIPAVAFDGTNFFVVWQTPDSAGAFDIYGVRIDTAGNILDTTEIPICTAVNSQENPKVAFDGTNFFVVWQDNRLGEFDIYGARVNTAGSVLDSAGIMISTANNWQEYPSVSFNRPYFLITWLDWRSGQPAVFCARLDTLGILLDSSGIFVSGSLNDIYTPGISSDGNNYFITWPDERSLRSHIYGARIDTTGAVLDPEGILLSTSLYSQWSSSGAFDGKNYFVVWEDYRRDEFSNIFGARIDTTGEVIEPSGIAVCTTSYSLSPKITYNDLYYLVVWSGIKAARFDTSGILLDSNFINLGSGVEPSLSFNGFNYFVAFRRNNDIFGIRIDSAGTVLEPAFRISPLADVEKYPAVAFDGTNYLVVWQDSRNEPSGFFDIYGTFVDTTGTVLDTSGFAISVSINIEQSRPAVAFDGTNFFVVWQDARNDFADIYGARVTTNGVVLDTAGILICGALSAQYKPAINFDGQGATATILTSMVVM